MNPAWVPGTGRTFAAFYTEEEQRVLAQGSMGKQTGSGVLSLWQAGQVLRTIHHETGLIHGLFCKLLLGLFLTTRSLELPILSPVHATWYSRLLKIPRTWHLPDCAVPPNRYAYNAGIYRRSFWLRFRHSASQAWSGVPSKCARYRECCIPAHATGKRCSIAGDGLFLSAAAEVLCGLKAQMQEDAFPRPAFSFLNSSTIDRLGRYRRSTPQLQTYIKLCLYNLALCP